MPYPIHRNASNHCRAIATPDIDDLVGNLMDHINGVGADISPVHSAFQSLKFPSQLRDLAGVHAEWKCGVGAVLRFDCQSTYDRIGPESCATSGR